MSKKYKYVAIRQNDKSDKNAKMIFFIKRNDWKNQHLDLDDMRDVEYNRLISKINTNMGGKTWLKYQKIW